MLQVNGLNELNKIFDHIEIVVDKDPGAALAILAPLGKELLFYSLEQRIRYHKIQAHIYTKRSQFQLGKVSSAKGLELSKQLSSPSILIADLSYEHGFALENLGDIDGAFENYLNGLEVAESLNDKRFIAYGFSNLGAIYYLTKRYERSLIMLNDALTIANKLDDEELKGSITSDLGNLYAYIYQEDKAMGFYRRSYNHYKAAGKPLEALDSLTQIGAHYLFNSRYEEAISIYKEIINSTEKQVSSSGLYLVYSGMAWAYQKKEDSDPQAARQYMLIAGQHVADAEHHEIQIEYAIDKAFLLDSMMLFEEALESLVIAEELINNKKQTYTTVPELNLYSLRANIYFSQEKFQNAYQEQSEYLAGYIQMRENKNTLAIEDIRLKYESEHADLEKQILEHKHSLKTVELRDASLQAKNQQLYLMVSVIVTLIFAWFLAKLVRGQRQLLKATRTDGLTGVANRRRLTQLGKRYFSRAVEKKRDFSILVMDIDNFKKINDLLGHGIGDSTLQNLAGISHGIMRKTDQFGRFDGGEFIVLLPDTNEGQALDIAQRLRVTIHQNQWDLAGIDHVTVSIGVAALDIAKHGEFEALIKSADLMLYNAKKNGKNRVCV